LESFFCFFFPDQFFFIGLNYQFFALLE